ncbi:MAG: flagellar hook basal-body protein [Arcobacter sp.]|nr:flagellar hook basal-body protein [Arcobacter sp.]
MIGALWTGISGLAAHQTALDNESNNIANVNTVGYKAGRISFADQIYQGKIGKGSFVQDAEKIFVTGGSKITGVEYDVALQGDGFFTVINKNTLGTAETFYTRAGNFRMGQSGTLQNPDGYEVQGWAMSSIDQKNDVKSTNQMLVDLQMLILKILEIVLLDMEILLKQLHQRLQILMKLQNQTLQQYLVELEQKQKLQS